MAGTIFTYSWLNFSAMPFHALCVIIHTLVEGRQMKKKEEMFPKLLLGLCTDTKKLNKPIFPLFLDYFVNPTKVISQ
jgi:hypothetical protein